ncbi:luciferase-like domain-containing protein [Lophiotrema nucula]|uniref:Luciferase-like domain-containing protein n=1 Tax=Lophiotrema nucula TaxID=690887 RepID=A0A6A5YQ07_9PLEO|nr:luciferase-like domain-containing protein [Lophiotrema nucula]
MAPKRIQICFLEIACIGGYTASGQWKRPEDTSTTKDKLKYYTDLAKLADRGKVSAIFFADWFVGFDVYGGGLDTMLKAGHQVAHLDPYAIVSAMAAVTENVSFAVTQSTTYSTPYVLARQFSALDHLTGGRSLGRESFMEHDERYSLADEFMDVVYKQDQEIEHKGNYFNMSGRSQVHPSPQRTPALFQAGKFKFGTAFATKHAATIFLNCVNAAQAKKTISDMRAAAAANGPLANADPVAGFAQFSGYTGIDLAQFLLDEPMDLSGMSQAMAIQAVFRAFEASEGEEKQLWTPRRLGMCMALGGLHPCPVGTAAEVADVIQDWIDEADIDGCNIGNVTNPGSWEDMVDLLVPELQRRGLMWEDYAKLGGTFRENLLGSKQLRDDPYGSSFSWKEAGASDCVAKVNSVKKSKGE